MTNTERAEIITFCDKVVKDGDKLSITWDGGGDSGEYQVTRNDVEILDEPTIIQRIMELTNTQLEHYGFDGEYSCEGSADYNPRSKSFEGTETHFGSDMNTLECQFALEIPNSLWFDKLFVFFEVGDAEELKVSMEFFLLNGPHSQLHQDIETKLANDLKAFVEVEIDSIQEFSYVNDVFRLDRSDFELAGHLLTHTIKGIDYVYNLSETKDICVSLLSN